MGGNSNFRWVAPRCLTWTVLKDAAENRGNWSARDGRFIHINFHVVVVVICNKLADSVFDLE